MAMDDLIQLVEQKLVRIYVEDIGAKIYRQCLDCGLILTISNFQKHCDSHTTTTTTTVPAPSSDKNNSLISSPPVKPKSKFDPVAVVKSKKNCIRCDICNRNFISQPWLRRHEFRFHISRKQVKTKDNLHYKCHHCKKTFSYPSQLKLHKKTHKKKSNFEKLKPKTKHKKQNIPEPFPYVNVVVVRDPEVERKGLELLNNKLSLNSQTVKSVGNSIPKAKSKSTTNEILHHLPSALVPTPNTTITNNLYELQSELNSIVEDFGKMDPVPVAPVGIQIKLEPTTMTVRTENTSVANFETNSFDSVPLQNGSSSSSSSISSSLQTNTSSLSTEHQVSVIDSVASNTNTPGTSISSKDTGSSNSSEVHRVVGSMKMEVDGVENNEGEGDTRKCLSCEQIVHLDDLFAHLRSHLYKGQRTCNFCDYKAIATGDLRDHVSKHYNFRPYKCPICFKCYTWQSGFKKHVQSHDVDQKPYKCSDENCSLKFTSQRERRRHELTHKNIAAPGSKVAKKSKAKNVSNSPGSSTKTNTPSLTPGSTTNAPILTPGPQVSKPVFNTTPTQQQYNPTSHPQYNNSPYEQLQGHNFQTQHYYQNQYESYSNSNSTQHYQYPRHTSPSNQVYTPPVPTSFSSSNPYSPNYTNEYTNANGYAESRTYSSSSNLSGNQNIHQTQSWNATPNYKSPAHIQNGPIPSLKETGTITPNTTILPLTKPNDVALASSTVTNSNVKEHSSSGGLDRNSNPKIFKEPEDTRISEQCKTCQIEVKMADLPAHILNHITPGQKLCSICKYKCNTKVYLIEHYNIHYSLKPFICTICTRRFAMRSYLRSHMQQVHETEESRNYKCRFCDKKFVRPCHQRSHEKIHENNGDSNLPPIERAKHRKQNQAKNTIIDSNHSDSSNSQPATPIRHPNSFPTPSKSSPSGTNKNAQHCHVANSHSSSPNPSQTVPAPAVVAPYQHEWQKPQAQPQSQWAEGAVSWQSYAAGPSQLDSSNQWGRSDYQYPPQESNSWSNSYYDSPVIRTDVNWTAQTPLDASQSWDTSFQTQNSTNIQYKQEHWYDSSSSGVYSTNDSSNIPPSASVQDLWTDLQYELKLLPEKTTYTSDGIPMVTEIAPVEVPSFTDLLNMVTSDLPGFTSPTKITTINPIPENRNIQPTITQPLEHSLATSSKSQHNLPTKPTGPGPRWRPQGRASGVKTKTRLTAEAKHRLNMEQENKDVNGLPAESPQQSTGGSESDGDDEDLSPTSVKTCLTCGKEVMVSELLDHIHNHLIPGQRTCDLCRRTYCNYVTLRDHVHVHYKLKPYKCNIEECTQTFMSKYTLKVHESVVHNQGPILKCEHCSKPYVMKSELVKHIKVHHPGQNGIVSLARIQNRRSTAELAAEEQRTKKLIEETKTRQAVIKLEKIGETMMMKCPFCNIEIKLDDLRQHKYAHKEECHICQKPVPVAEVLYHGPTHVAAMICEVCGWSGAQQRSQLWEHMNGHLQVKPLRCFYCGIGFASRNSLRSHYLALHTKFRPHKCRYCDKTFVQGNTVKQHELTHFGTQCPICNQNFELKKDLRNHLKDIHKESE